jgi:diacylglycerol kinase (ATP)
LNADRTNAIVKKKVLLVYNPKAGTAIKQPDLLDSIIREMHSWDIEPELLTVEPYISLREEIGAALKRGYDTVAVCGGDGTLSAVADILASSGVVLAILPGGTENNTARSMGIPLDAEASVALLKSGRHREIDLGLATCGTISTHFLEQCAVGLISDLSLCGEDIRHGKLARIGDFLSTLIGSQPSDICIQLDGGQKLCSRGHVVLVTNMPSTGLHFQVANAGAQTDGLLDILYLADLSKADLLRHLSTGVYVGKPEDPRIARYTAHKISIDTTPPLTITADGDKIGKGSVTIEVRPRALGILTP